MFVQEWHLIQPMLLLPVCHHSNMGTNAAAACLPSSQNGHQRGQVKVQ